jgi:beta-glucanase (GH16 family)
MDNRFWSIVLLFIMIACGKIQLTAQESANTYRLVWSDEFDADGLPDQRKWAYDMGDGCPNVCNWGNNELQYYTSELKNAHVKDGYLVISAIKEPVDKYQYSSSRMITKNKGDWKYGKIEVRAKLPRGRGVWPAIWMLPTDWKYGGWPESGEIDIMEHVGFEPDSVWASVHTKTYNHVVGTQKTKGLYLSDVDENFHVYSIEWTASNITGMVDGKPYFSFSNEGTGHREWPFDQPFHLLLNIAVGGNWGGKKGVDDTIFPQQMLVDYVRIYQK